MLDILETFVGVLIATLGIVLLGKIVLQKNIEVNKIQFTIILLISAIIYTIISLCLKDTVKTLCLFVLVAIMYKLIYRVSINKTILLTVIFAIVAVIAESITLWGLFNIFNMTKEYCYEVFAGSLISNLLICVVLIFITIILKKILRKIININMATNKKIIVFSILVFISILIFFFKAINAVAVDGDIITFVFAIVVFLLVLGGLFKQKYDNDKLATQYDGLLEFMKEYEAEIERQRILRHETKNQLLTIKSKIVDKNDEKQTIEYIDNILGDSTKFVQEKYAKFQYLPANGIKGLFYFKAMEAERKHINVDISVSKEIENSYLKDLSAENFKQLGQIIGVYFDNAIEASSNSKDKNLGIELYMLDNNIELIISNSYANEIDKNKLGKNVFSTKGKNRGHGLLLVKSIIRANKIFDEELTITDKLYIQKLIIKK